MAPRLRTTATLGVPASWPVGPACARYDLVFVFDRPSGRGPITGFTLFPQQLLAGDLPSHPSLPPGRPFHLTYDNVLCVGNLYQDAPILPRLGIGVAVAIGSRLDNGN
jgi:hypothetical protein